MHPALEEAPNWALFKLNQLLPWLEQNGWTEHGLPNLLEIEEERARRRGGPQRKEKHQ